MALAHFFQHLPWVTIFGLLGNTISFMVFLSPIPTFHKIYKKKSTEGFQSIPYVIALFSSVLWLFYAFIKPGLIFLITINSFGVVVEIIYLTMYLIYATKEARVLTVKLLLLINVFGFGVIVFFTLVIAKTNHARLLILGWVCLIFSLSVFVAPLGVMKQVIKSRSVKYMPFALSFFLTISAVVWFFYGLFKRDYNIAIPNVLGFSFGILQMVLYAMYRNAKPVLKEIEVGKKEISDEQIIIEPVKVITTQPKSGPKDGDVYAIEIPASLHVINNDNDPMDKRVTNRINGLNYTSPQLAVVV